MRRVLFLILITNSLLSFGQGIDQTFGFANKLYEDKSYQNAMEAYKKVLYFDSTGTYSKNIYPKMADCLFNLNQYQEAADYFDLSYFSTEDSLSKDYFILKKVSCFLILRQYDFADIEFLNLNDNISDSLKTEKTFQEAMLRFSKGEYAASENAFKKLNTDSIAVSQLFKKNEKVSKISPKKAKIMSMVMPGLGQLYVGDVKNGLNSFILTVGLLTLGIHSALVNSPLDAAISILPWFQRYYQGGFNKAEIIAKSKIQEKRYIIFNKLLDEVEKGK